MRIEQNGPGTVFQLFRSGQASTRADVVRLTGMARATATQRIESLVRAGLLRPSGQSISTGGRPPTRFEVDSSGGIFLVADVGGTSPTKVAATDLDGLVLAREDHQYDLADGPTAVLGAIADVQAGLVRATGHSPTHVRGVGLALPGPVEYATGRVISPPIMPGWNQFDIAAFLGRGTGYPILVENDVNAQAFGEQRTCWPDHRHLLMIEVGTGIGCGIIVNGELYRGALGAAGDLGHIPYAHGEGVGAGPVCRCGNLGCIEAYAGGWAVARELSRLGLHTRSTDDVVEVVRSGQPEAMTLIRNAAHVLGSAISDAVSLLNPSIVVLGGALARQDTPLLAGVREVVYRNSLLLATRNLELTLSRLGQEAGLRGLGLMLADLVFAPDAIDHRLAVSPNAASTVA